MHPAQPPVKRERGGDLPPGTAVHNAAIFVAGIVYYVLFLRPRRDRYWAHLTAPEEVLDVPDRA